MDFIERDELLEDELIGWSRSSEVDLSLNVDSPQEGRNEKSEIGMAGDLKLKDSP